MALIMETESHEDGSVTLRLFVDLEPEAVLDLVRTLLHNMPAKHIVADLGRLTPEQQGALERGLEAARKEIEDGQAG